LISLIFSNGITPNNVIPVHAKKVFRRMLKFGAIEYIYPIDIKINKNTIGTIYHKICKLLLAKVVLSSRFVVANAMK
jgi:hypothetical protein